jgi:predicted site-specific integrase-resolvase
MRPQQVAVSARVCSAEHRKHVDGQAERVAAYCAAKGWQVAKGVTAWGSGIQDQRPPLLAVLADTRIRQIVVEQQDRCSRCGVAYIQTLLQTQGRELVSVNAAEDGQDDVREDLVASITSCCARLSGRRRANRTKPQLLAALEAT